MFSISILSTLALAAVQLPPGHPNVQQALQSGTKLPAGHPVVDSLVSPFSGHPNIDDMLKAGKKLPAGHPNVDSSFSYSIAKPTTAPAPVTTTTTTPPAVVKTTQPQPVKTTTAAAQVIITTTKSSLATPPAMYLSVPSAPTQQSQTYVAAPIPTQGKCPSSYPAVTVENGYSAGPVGTSAGPSATQTIGTYSSAATASTTLWIILLSIL